MEVLEALGQTLVKMFAADLWLSVGAIAVVAACGAGLAGKFLTADDLPFVMLAGIVATLALGILRGATPNR